MHPSRFLTITIRLSFVLFLLAGASVHAERFSFVALGDTAYNVPEDYPIYRSLIERINSVDPAFSIHVGDTWGALECSVAEHERILDFFDDYDHPVIYTPGDNEWVDCVDPQFLPNVQRFLAGKPTKEDLGLLAKGTGLEGGMARSLYGDGFSSLRLLRKIFFANDRSMGANPITLMRQADVSDHKQMVENAIWTKDDVLFGTVHVPGSANNFFINSEAHALEAIARNKANVAWLQRIFAEAAEQKSKAVVVALHAGMFVEGEGGDFTGQAVRGGQSGPFHWIVLAIRDLASAYGQPVLLINGDFHELVIDRPFLVYGGESEPPKYANITRLQVFGAPEIKAVKVTVDTDTPWVFEFAPLHN